MTSYKGIRYQIWISGIQCGDFRTLVPLTPDQVANVEREKEFQCGQPVRIIHV